MGDPNLCLQDYIAAFEPLMLEEIVAVMLRGLEETNLVAPEKCVPGPTVEASSGGLRSLSDATCASQRRRNSSDSPAG